MSAPLATTATSTTSTKEVTSSEPQATFQATEPLRKAEPAPQPQATPRGPTVTVNGPPSGITVAGHGFWLMPPNANGEIWAVFRPDGAYYFFPNDQQKK